MTPAILVCTCMYMHFVQSTICNITFTYIIPKAYSLVTLTNVMMMRQISDFRTIMDVRCQASRTQWK